LLEPGRVRPAGEGLISISADSRLLPLIRRFEQAGFEIHTSENTDALVWAKLVINAAINPLTAILGITNGELLQRPSARALMGACAQEVVRVAHALHIRLPYQDAVGQVEKVSKETAQNHSSMLQDIGRGAPTEIEAINGEIVRRAERLGVDTPVNYTLWQLVKALAGGLP
jgi:2-dehydropantoate 2-reductase